MKDMIEVVDLLIKKVREVRPDYVCTVQYKKSARARPIDSDTPTQAKDDNAHYRSAEDRMPEP